MSKSLIARGQVTNCGWAQFKRSQKKRSWYTLLPGGSEQPTLWDPQGNQAGGQLLHGATARPGSRAPPHYLYQSYINRRKGLAKATNGCDAVTPAHRVIKKDRIWSRVQNIDLFAPSLPYYYLVSTVFSMGFRFKHLCRWVHFKMRLATNLHS